MTQGIAATSEQLVISSGDYAESVDWNPPAPGEMCGSVDTANGPVRVVEPRGRIPGSTRYPGPLPPPRIRAAKLALAPDRLAYYPERHVTEHPTAWAFPSYLDNPSCAWLQTLKKLYGMPISFPASLSPEAGLMLHGLVRNIRPKLVIETGTFIGMSTMWIASALKENGDGGVVHTFDDMTPIRKGPWRDAEITHDRIHFVAELFTEAGLAEHIVMHPGNSSIELRAVHKELMAEGGAQLAFLDADHGYTGVCQDLWATEPVLNTGGFLLFHDTFPEYCSHDGARRVMDSINQIGFGGYEKVDLYLSPMNYGMGLLRRIG